jgi:NADH:ubiquinone reductase (H+-translocating)
MPMKFSYPKASPEQKVVIVVGGGFAGLNAAQVLVKDKGIYVVLADLRNHHLFQPMLYQVATAGLEPADIAVPIRAQFDGVENIAIHLAEIKSVDLAGGAIRLPNGSEVEFDYLILACGAHHSYFGKPQWEEFAPGLKTLEQATETRRRILSAFEFAENERDPALQRALLNFVVVGGGPSGVELAGAIADISRSVLLKDFRWINPASARVILVEAQPRILKDFPEALSNHARSDLTKIGVEVRTSARVEEIDEFGVKVGSERIPSRTVLWAAGVQAPAITQTLGVELDRAGRVKVGPDLSIPKYPHVFVVGDLAHLELGNGKLLPGMAPAAVQTGRRAAHNIIADIRGHKRKPFKYLDKGMMATIGKRRAIAQSGNLRLTGFLAWLAWLFVHIFYLAGFGKKLAVFSKWAWSYAFAKRGSRLILSQNWRSETPSQSAESRRAA